MFMENNKPATPAQAATPGEGTVPAAPAATPTPKPGEGATSQEGKVTISTKEFAQLQRDAARAKSNERRNNLKLRTTHSDPGADPSITEAVDEANERASRAEKEALKFQVKGQVRDLLEKDEFKNLPPSTKNLILTNPHLLSQADNLEEAMLDIEDFIRDQVLSQEITSTTATPKIGVDPEGHETPPVSNSGGPAPTNGSEFEDTSKLSGPDKSRAMIRNKLRKPTQK